MTAPSPNLHSAFQRGRCIARGPLAEVAVAVREALDLPDAPMPLVIDEASGAQVDLDLRGAPAQVARRYRPAEVPAPAPSSVPADPTPRRGRPSLGVVAREVTLLPEHWDWLAAQPGGASTALRRLVHEARRAGVQRERERAARDRTWRAMSALAGDRPGFEEASRALFAGDAQALAERMARWPADVRALLLRLCVPDPDTPNTPTKGTPPQDTP